MRRPDASMSLLTDVQEGALEPEYRQPHTGSSPVRLAVVIALIVALLTLAVVQTALGSGADADQRAELVNRVTAARAQEEDLTDEITALEAEIRSLGAQALGDPAERQRLDELELAIGAVPVSGPGIIVTVGDAPNAADGEGLVLDSDLSRLVNGLWEAGAESIAINGRRLSALTPIRSAGSAITVDFVSLSPPYRVEVIGDPNTLQARFNQTAGASWWQFLTTNYGLTMTLEQSEDDLELAADPGMTVRYATAG